MIQPEPMRMSPGTSVGITGKQTHFSLLEFLHQRDRGQWLLGPILATAEGRACLRMKPPQRQLEKRAEEAERFLF